MPTRLGIRFLPPSVVAAVARVALAVLVVVVAAVALLVVAAKVAVPLLRLVVRRRLPGPKTPLVCANSIRFNTRWAPSPTGVLFLSSWSRAAVQPPPPSDRKSTHRYRNHQFLPLTVSTRIRIFSPRLHA
jgi:hypothetical protein